LYYVKDNLKAIHVLAITFLTLTSCGTYQQATYDDGIYGSGEQRAETAAVVEDSDNSNSAYQNYFEQKSFEAEDRYGDIFTDVDSYSSQGDVQQQSETDVDAIGYNESYSPWGETAEDITINVYGGPQFGWANGWGWNNWGWGFGGGWGWNNWGWGNGWRSPYYAFNRGRRGYANRVLANRRANYYSRSTNRNGNRYSTNRSSRRGNTNARTTRNSRNTRATRTTRNTRNTRATRNTRNTRNTRTTRSTRSTRNNKVRSNFSTRSRSYSSPSRSSGGSMRSSGGSMRSSGGSRGGGGRRGGRR